MFVFLVPLNRDLNLVHPWEAAGKTQQGMVQRDLESDRARFQFQSSYFLFTVRTWESYLTSLSHSISQEIL